MLPDPLNAPRIAAMSASIVITFADSDNVAYVPSAILLIPAYVVAPSTLSPA
jgi:hypothetical protein